MNIDPTPKLNFDDVLIKPKRSLAVSRAKVNLKKIYRDIHSGTEISGIPIISANMYNTGTIKMAIALATAGCFGALHKFYDIEEIVELYKKNPVYLVGQLFYSMGISDKDLAKAEDLRTNKNVSYYFSRKHFSYPHAVCIDVANGYTSTFISKIKDIRGIFPESFILAGNVATSEGVQDILNAGASCVKVGIGPGSLCETRKVTGVGYPQLSSVIECSDTAHGFRFNEGGPHGLICSDGGCKEPGDVAKAIAGGADFVMIGGMFMGYDECCGEIVIRDSQKYFECFGMSSEIANTKFYGRFSKYKAAEGKTELIPAKNESVRQCIDHILGGLRSTCTYVGTEDIRHLSKCTTFIRT